MSESLSLLFPQLFSEPPVTHKGELAPVLNKFERMAMDPDSPIRAIDERLRVQVSMRRSPRP